MGACMQAPGMNMLEHGDAVRRAYIQLLDELRHGTAHPFLQTMWPWLQDRLYAPELLAEYQYWHDCGKHLTLTVDDTGRRHYPGHAQASAEQYRLIFPQQSLIAELIAMDMEFHTLRGADLITLWEHPHASSLYLTAWAEIYANAQMFGGTASESFKIKRSRLIQAGKKSPFLTKE